jgi:hypothetical protein
MTPAHPQSLRRQAETVGLRPSPEHLCLVRRCSGCGRLAKLAPWRKCKGCEPDEVARREGRKR